MCGKHLDCLEHTRIAFPKRVQGWDLVVVDFFVGTASAPPMWIVLVPVHLVHKLA